MEEILKAFVDEVAKRVLAKMAEDTEKMRDFFKVKIKVEDVEGIEDLVDNHLDDKLDDIRSDCEGRAEEAGRKAAEELVENLTVEIHT